MFFFCTICVRPVIMKITVIVVVNKNAHSETKSLFRTSAVCPTHMAACGHLQWSFTALSMAFSGKANQINLSAF